MRDTPARLRALQVGCAVAVVVLAVVGGLAFWLRTTALADARAHAAQAIRVQGAAEALVKADAAFTAGYLAFGAGAGTSSAYDSAIADASSLLAQASAAEPADATRLATVQQSLSVYTARVAAAQVNNRLGKQVATGYLRQASYLLRGTPADLKTVIPGTPMLPLLATVAQDDASRVDSAFSTFSLAGWLFSGAAVLALLGLGLTQLWIARFSHRILNLPLVAASVLVLAVVVLAGVALATSGSKASAVRSGPYAAATALSTARDAAFGARSAESITVIYIGTGGPVADANAAFTSSFDQARAALTRAKAAGASVDPALLTAWSSAHTALVAQANTAWTAAAASSASTSAGSVQTTFAAVDAATSTALTRQAALTSNDLAQPHTLLGVTGVLALLLGLLAAAAGWAGVAQRLGEYR